MSLLIIRRNFMHFCAKVQPEMHVDAYYTGHTEIQKQTVIHWPTEPQKTKEPQNKSDHGCHLSSLSVSLSLAPTQKHTYLETQRHRRHCHDLMYWNVHFTSTENAGQYQSQMTDKPSNTDSIFDVWWSHTETEKKTQKQTATRRYHIWVNTDKTAASNKCMAYY